jgi:hypothetical protein
MARTRIRGKQVKFTLNGHDYECDLVSAVLEKVDAPSSGTDTVTTFCDASTSAGGQVWQLSIEAVQSTDTSAATDGESLHTLIWDSAATAGGAKIPFVFMTHGNATASAEQPHFTGTAVVEAGAYPAVGGTAGENSFTWTYEFYLDPDVVTRKIA